MDVKTTGWMSFALHVQTEHLTYGLSSQAIDIVTRTGAIYVKIPCPEIIF